MKRLLIGVVVGLLVGGVPSSAGPRSFYVCRQAESAVAVVADHADYAAAFHRELLFLLRHPGTRAEARAALRGVIAWETSEADASTDATRLSAECVDSLGSGRTQGER
jgi:hypothetical protein